jgi:2'-5' RNA ligase
MNYTIGIGALLDTDAFNTVRSLELAVASATNNFAGLGQPPHITIKRPFEVVSVDDIDKVLAQVEEVVEKTPAFTVQYSGLGNFGHTTLFLAVETSPELQKLHRELLSRLKESFTDAESPHEGQQMVFHTSIATNLQEDQFESARKKIYGDVAVACHIRKLGLFLGIDNNTHWAVIAEKELS